MKSVPKPHDWMRSTHAVFLGLAVVVAAGWGLLTIFSSQIFPARAADDFRTQMVKLTIPAGSVSSSVFAPDDFERVDPSRTILLISGITQHAMGAGRDEGQTPDEISARVELASSTAITATRASAGADIATEVWVLLIEYTGEDGGANEFIVRDMRVHIWEDGAATSSYGPVRNIRNPNNVVVFNAGTSNPNTNLSHFDRADVRSFLSESNNVQLSRGDGVGAILSSHQVVEFTGSKWHVQQGNTAPAPSPDGADVAIEHVGDIANAWVYFTWETDDGALDERGHRVFLSSPTSLRAQEDANATAQKVIHWNIISHPEMRVQTGQAESQYSDSLTASISGFAPVQGFSRSFAWMSGTTNLGDASHPRDMWQFALTGANTITMERGRSGASLDYYYAVVELPSTSAPDSAPTPGAQSIPTSLSIAINNGDVCTSSRNVTLAVRAQDAVEVLFSNDQTFRDAFWEPFVDPKYTSWELSEGDGEKTVHVVFRSPSQDMSVTTSTSIYLDQSGDCGLVEESEPEPEPQPQPEEPSACTGRVFTRFMTRGDVDVEVRELQSLLQCLGHFPADVETTAIFGPITEDAVKSFQANHGVDPVGYVGPATREALNVYAE